MRLRLYLDTSVFGGVWDKEFSKPSLTLLNQIKNGKFDLVVSEVVQERYQALL